MVKFTRIKSDSLLSNIVRIINLQTIVNIINNRIGDSFRKGFAFDTLKAKLYILNKQIFIQQLTMSSLLTNIKMSGYIDLKNNKTNIDLVINPRIGLGIAIGTGIATLNPLIGLLTYLAEAVFKTSNKQIVWL